MDATQKSILAGDVEMKVGRRRLVESLSFLKHDGVVVGTARLTVAQGIMTISAPPIRVRFGIEDEIDFDVEFEGRALQDFVRKPPRGEILRIWYEKAGYLSIGNGRGVPARRLA